MHTTFYHKVLIHVILLIAINAICLQKVRGQETKHDTLIRPDTTVAGIASADSTTSGNSSLRTKVIYSATDSIIMDNREQKAYLFGDAVVEYEDIKLKAAVIEINFEKSLAVAKGVPDSTGKLVGTPVFYEKTHEYKAKEMVYNFETKKGIIREARTQEGQGYIHGYKVKLASDNVFYIKNGKYTTCNLDHPHFYIKAGKLKIINNDKIVTGPAYMAIEDVPTPLAVPFGFFPNNMRRRSGFIIPQFGGWQTKGYSLTDGGYYLAISEHIDLKLLGDIYTNGSWAARAISNYKVRYKFSGSFNVNYMVSKTGDPDSPDYTLTRDFFVRWTHIQDPKANPNSSFSASVNLGSSNYFQNDFNTSNTDYQRNEFKSNITYSYRFGTSPFAVSVNANHNQNNRDTTISITLPELTLTMNRIFPFKRKNPVGRSKWYESIGLSYTMNMRNEIEAKEYAIFQQQTFDNMRNGLVHVIPLSTSLKAGPVSISPGLSWRDTWYIETYRKKWDTANEEVVMDTIPGFNRFGQGNANITVSTRLYGLYSFKKKGARVKALRHTMTPNVSFSYTPDLTPMRPEVFYEYVSDTNGTVTEGTVFDGAIYGAPSTYQRAIVSFNLQNIVEIKHKPKNDTTGKYQNKTIIDAINFRANYDIFKDSINWSPITMDIRTTIGKIFNIRFTTVGNIYAIDDNGRLTGKTEYSVNRNLLRLTTFRSNIGIRLKGKPRDASLPAAPQITPQQRELINDYYEQYIDFNIPWSLNIDYSFAYNKQGLEPTFVNSMTLRGDVNITPRWKIGFTTGYDFERGEVNFTRFNIYRDLHCWQFNLDVIPFGPRTSFMFSINVKSPVLQDLKLSRRRNWFDLQ